MPRDVWPTGIMPPNQPGPTAHFHMAEHPVQMRYDYREKEAIFGVNPRFHLCSVTTDVVNVI